MIRRTETIAVGTLSAVRSTGIEQDTRLFVQQYNVILDLSFLARILVIVRGNSGICCSLLRAGLLAVPYATEIQLRELEWGWRFGDSAVADGTVGRRLVVQHRKQRHPAANNFCQGRQR